jgi:hypothetical protein
MKIKICAIATKALYVLLAAIIATGGFFAGPAGAVRADTDGDYTYTLSGDNATITGYTGLGGAVVIPATLGGHSVTSIGDNAFSNKTTLTSVIIPNGVTSISRGAFAYCSWLNGVTIGSGVTSIGEQAFSGCSRLTAITVAGSNTAYSSQDGVLFNKAKTSILQYPGGKAGSYVIPVSVTSIGSWAFAYCTKLTSVTIPAGVTSIGEYAFFNCSKLTSVTIPAGVTSIGEHAFFNCSKLTSVTIPAGVTSIGDAAFAYCSGLTEIIVAGGNTAYSSQDGILFNKTKASILQYPGGKSGSYVIPVSVTLIGDTAFEACSGLTSVTIPAGVTSIGSYAFQYCSGLTAAYFLGNAPSCTNSTFNNCHSGFTIYYVSGKTGWTNPWYGYTTAVAPPIVVTSPNGGESWSAGSNRNVAWISPGVSGNVDIAISRDGGSSWSPIFSNITNDSSETWTVTGPATTLARIKVSSVADASVSDTSDANFAITPGPNITITSPNGGETWGTGSSGNITWTSNGVTGNVNIQLSRDGGATYTTIIPNTPIAAGTKAWTVTSPVTTTARIKVISISTPSVFDASDANFTIATPPALPTLVSPTSGAVVSTLTPALDWNDSTGASTYGVQVSAASSFTTTLVNQGSLGASNFTVPSSALNWNMTYYWRANAANAAGNSAWSTSRTFRTGPGPAPDAPYGLSAAPVSSTQINLAWNDNSTIESGFKIERRKAGTTTYALVATVGTDNRTYSNTTGLTANTQYVYRVRAYNFTSNYSAYSNEDDATTLPLPPAAPTLVSPAVGATTENLTPRLDWNNSIGDNITYGVQVSTASSFATDNLTVNRIGLPTSDYIVLAGDGLEWNKTYYWRANATNIFNSTSRWSASRTFKTAWGHPRPTNLIATPISATRIDLAWTDNSTGEAGFKVERKKAGTVTWAQVATVGTDNHTYSNTTGLTANTQYFYRVRAYLGTTLNSAYSDNASATTGPLAPTLASPAINATSQSVTPTLDWSDTAGAVSYRVQVSTVATFASTAVDQSVSGATNSTYTVVSALNPGTQYFWRVNATNGTLSTSAWSLVRSFTTGP